MINTKRIPINTIEINLIGMYSVYKKIICKVLLLIWQLWMLRINDPQKHKVLYI